MRVYDERLRLSGERQVSALQLVTARLLEEDMALAKRTMLLALRHGAWRRGP